MGKAIKKIITALWGTLLAVMFMLLSLFAVTQIPPVQRWVGSTAGDAIGASLGVPVRVSSIRYFPFNTFEIGEVLVLDRDSLPMLGMRRLKADVSVRSLWSGCAEIDLVEADSLSVTVRQRADGSTNLSDIGVGGEGETPRVWVGTVRAGRGSVTLWGKRSLSARDIEVNLSDIEISEQGAGVTIANIGMSIPQIGKERVSMSGRVKASGDTIFIDDIALLSEIAELKVRQAEIVADSAEIRSAKAEIPVLQLSPALLEELTGRQLPPLGIGIKGTMDSRTIDAEWFRLSVGRGTFVTGHATADRRSLEREKMPTATVTISDGRSHVAELCALLGTELSETMADELGIVSLNGEAESNPTTASGSLHIVANQGTADITLRAESADEWATTTLNALATTNTNLTTLTSGMIGANDLTVSARGRMRGSEITLANIEGHATHMQLLGATYSHTLVNAVMDGSRGDMLLDISDAARGELKVIGEADWTNRAKPYTSLTVMADSLDISHMAKIGETAILDGRMRLETEGRDASTMDGALQLADITLRTDKDTACVETLIAELADDAEGVRQLTLMGSTAQGTMRGSFDIQGIGREMLDQAMAAAPSLFTQAERAKAASRRTKHRREQLADIDLTLSGIEPWLRIWAPSADIADTVTIRGRINSQTASTWANVSMPHMASGDIEARSLSAALLSHNGTVAVAMQASQMHIPMIGTLHDLRVDTETAEDKTTADAQWRGDGFLNAEIGIGRDETDALSAQVSVDRSQLTLGKQKWTMDSCRATLSKDLVDIGRLLIYNGTHSVEAYGRASAKAEDTLRIKLHDLVLDDLLADYQSTKYSLSGLLSTEATVTAAFGKMEAMCAANIERLVVNGDKLEHLDLQAHWIPDSSRAEVGARIVTGGLPRVMATGEIDIAAKKTQIDMEIDSLSTGFLNFYLDACIDSWQGSTSGKLSIFGPLDDIKMDARLKMNDDNTFRVMSTNCRYRLAHNDSVYLLPHAMLFRDIRFTDQRGRTGVFGGGIRHRMYRGLYLDLDFDVDNMELLHTTPRESPSYYGTVYGTGHMDVTGTTDNVAIEITAQTGAESDFVVVPTAKGDLSEQDYISFRSNDKEDIASATLDRVGKGTRATLNLDITPQAQLSIVIDPQTDNRLTGHGRGQIRIDVDRNGEMSMFGDYVIERGLYNFSFENVISKQFVINDGGRIGWDGGAYDADLDITATYKLKASLYDLVRGGADEDNSDLKRRVPINCNIHLSEKLTDPQIKFDIEIPSSQNFNQYTFDQYVSTDEEMNRQVFSLLMAGRFYATQTDQGQNAQGSSYLGTTASELISNQLSSLFSKNKHNVGVGVNYRPGDEVTNEEYEVALSTQVLNNTILLSGNIGYGRDASSAGSDDGSLIGDFDIEVKLNKQGNIRAKAYTHSNNDVIYETSPTTQGIGISFQEEFDSFRDLFRKYFDKIFRRKRDEPDEKKEAEE